MTPTESYLQKVKNLEELSKIVAENRGVRQVGVIANSGDGEFIIERLNQKKRDIFRSDAEVSILIHQERNRRGQLLGLLDAHGAWGQKDLPNAGDVWLGIMLPGKGTRLSPLTQRLNGIKPLMPMLIRTNYKRDWLSGAEASLYAWNLVAYHLGRMGFKGVAWKWGDEPQIPATCLSELDYDLNDVDIVRFGSITEITEDLARNKEWLVTDETGNLTCWVRRTDRQSLLRKMKIKDVAGIRAKAMIHIGSPAFSNLFLEEANEAFKGLPQEIWLDVDGYLMEGLTLTRSAWQEQLRLEAMAEAASKTSAKSDLKRLLLTCPDFYQRCQLLKKNVERRRRKPLTIKVINFGDDLYWGDIGQLEKARDAIYSVALDTPKGLFARKLACIDGIFSDEFGNMIVGDTTCPKGSMVRNSVLINTKIYGKANIEGAVLIDSNIGYADIKEGSVVFGSDILDLTMGRKCFSFLSVKENLRVADYFVHTSMPGNIKDVSRLDDWWADSRINVGSEKYYNSPVFGNPKSFQEAQSIMRQRTVSPQTIELGVKRIILQKLVPKMNLLKERSENLKPLRFGTSGLRATDEELTDIQVYVYTRGFIEYLKSLKSKSIKEGDAISLAGDFRPSTPRIWRAVSAAIIDSSFKVDFCGRIPTPALTLWGIHHGRASIMVTGSHNPYGHNGIKFNRSDGEILKSEEKQIVINTKKVIKEICLKPESEFLFDKSGNFKDKNDLGSAQGKIIMLAERVINNSSLNAYEHYIDRYKKAFGKVLKGERVVFYQQSAVGRDIIPEIFQALGAEVVTAGRLDEKKTFLPLDTEDMKPFIIEQMAQYAYQNNSDICITTDGDSDRPALVFLKSDAPGYEYLKGDKLNVLTALLIVPEFVAVPITVNKKAIQLLDKRGIRVKLTRVGSPYVNQAMINYKNFKQAKNMRLYGFEVNGGGLNGSDFSLPKSVFNSGLEQQATGELSFLPTRDAVLPLVCAMIFKKNQAKNFQQLMLQVFSACSDSAAGVVDNLPGISITDGCGGYTAEVGRGIIKRFSPINKSIIEVEFRKDNIIFKDSNLLPVKINNRREIYRMKEIGRRLTGYFSVTSSLKKARISKINYLDGLCLYLSNDEIIHLRPSGNAAQFRVYAEAASLSRASEIVNESICPNTGMVVRIINDYLAGEQDPASLESNSGICVAKSL